MNAPSFDVETESKKLEVRAKAIHDNLLQFASRAFVIEFAGTPKSGKSTSVESIRHFFTRQDFRVHVLSERAAICPIPMKGHLFFNSWCATTMLAELLANVDTETDIIIVDRGIFDALVWLTLQKQRQEVTADEAQIIEAFLLLERWRSLIDLAIVMNVPPEEALLRETSQRISSKPGSIMNPGVLGNISTSVAQAVARYGSKFPAVIEYQTSGQDIRASNIKLGDKILDQFTGFLDPEILVIPRRDAMSLPLVDDGCFLSEGKAAILECITNAGKFMRRSQAELDPEYVQVIACGLLVHNDEVFLFERKERDPKYSLYGKSTVWQGAHVASVTAKRGEALLQSALLDRISESLFLSRLFPMALVGYCWEPDNERSSRHLGVIFKVEIDNDHTAADLRKKEFRHGRGHGLAGRFVSWKALTSKEIQPNLEGWSTAILKSVKDIKGLKQAV